MRCIVRTIYWLSMTASHVRNESSVLFFFQAEDGIRDLVRSRGLGDVYKRQGQDCDLDQARHGVRCGEEAHRDAFERGGRQGQGLSLIHI